MSTRKPSANRWVGWRLAGIVVAFSLLGLTSCTHLTGAPPGAPPAALPATPVWLPAGTAPVLGQPLTVTQRNQLRPAIYPEGAGLPAGQGRAADGAPLYAAQCAACHGAQGEGGTAPELVGGEGPLTRPDADKTLRTYWPYATTLFDTIARSMPPAAPGHLSAEQLYALCAWLLARNGLWPESRPLDAAGLASVRMPNRDGFISHADDAP